MTGRKRTGPTPTPERRVLLHYTQADGTPAHTPSDSAALIAFESGRLHRPIPSYANQKNTPGLYWSATDQRLLDYESFLESKWMTLLDFDPTVVAIAPQPFKIQALDPAGSWEHTPDLFLRLRDGGGRVMDVKQPRKLNDADVILQATRTQRVCEEIGFDYQLVGEPDPMLWRNVRWLAGYRRPIALPPGLTDLILAAARTPIRFGDLTDAFDLPELARTAALRACWFGQLSFDLTQPLRDTTLIHTTEEP